MRLEHVLAIQQARKPLFELVAELRAAQAEREMLLYPIQQWYATVTPKIFATVEHGVPVNVRYEYPPLPSEYEVLKEFVRQVEARVVALTDEIARPAGEAAAKREGVCQPSNS